MEGLDTALDAPVGIGNILLIAVSFSVKIRMLPVLMLKFQVSRCSFSAVRLLLPLYNCFVKLGKSNKHPDKQPHLESTQKPRLSKLFFFPQRS